MGRRKLAARLTRRRDRLLAQADSLSKEIAALGFSPASATGGKRFRNEQTLPEALAALLKNRTMSVTEAAIAVQEAGYLTTATNFRTMVNIQLTNRELFRRVSRGRYTTK